MGRIIKTIIIAFIFGLLGGALSNIFFDGEESNEELIKDFYAVENAVHVSPHGIRKHINDGTFILVDLRSEEEYVEEHIIGALSVPAYKDRDHSDYGATERITNSFREIVEENPGKYIIVYCYSIPCMTGRKVGKILADEGIYVKHLGVGWNEWRYFWTLWNHPHEWNQTNVEDYIASGPEPGVFGDGLSTGCPIDGSLGC
jgi:rhodanese-related sulfurtransferase